VCKHVLIYIGAKAFMQTVLWHLRKSKGLSQQQVASCLKVSVETISALEGGLLYKIAAFYDVTIEALFWGSSAKNDQAELLKLYNSLDDHSKGKLLERASYLVEESSK
jgi:transcriptional regulator with XRE-family HTH domain